MSVSKDKGRPGDDAGEVRLEAAHLYQLCLKGNDQAWRTLYTWCRNKAAKVLPHQAEGVAQQVCMKLLEGGLERVREPKAFLGYVSRAVSNEVVNRFRAKKGMVSLDQPLAGHDDDGLELGQTMTGSSPVPEEQAAARMLLARLGGVIETLPEYCQGVMALYVRYRMGLVASYKEMAQKLEVSVNTLGVQIKRCLDQLRQKPEFREMLDTGEGE